jgi:DNA mismatch repair protein MutS2
MAGSEKRALAPGDRVQVAALGKGTVREVRNGRYLVEVKGASFLVSAAQLRSMEEPHRARKTTSDRLAPPRHDARPSPSRGHSLDLHGKTVPEAIEAVDDFLNRVLLDGAGEVRIIHGRSGGRVKAAVHARLKMVGSIRRFRLEPGNPGVTIVTL